MTVALPVLTLTAVAFITASLVRRPVARDCAVQADDQPRSIRPSVLAVVGRRVRTAFRQPEDPALDRTVGRGLCVVIAVAVIQIEFAAILLFAIWVHSMLRRRRKARHNAAQVSAGLADVIDLFAVALLSGNTVAEATAQVCAWSDGEFADAFAWCGRRVATGSALSDVLESLPARLGPQTRPLIAALVATERYGAPVATNLAQLAAETRSDRRRQAEASARRLPVELLFPLVVCVLPAFLLVTVVPVIIETMANLDVAASP